MRPWRAVLGVAILSAVLLATGCALPARGALAAKLWPVPAATPLASGASPAQYYTLSAFRVADRLATASNALDDGITDRAEDRIDDAYLVVIAERSSTAAQEALSAAGQLTPPPELHDQANSFTSAVVTFAGAVEATRRALEAPAGSRGTSLLSATRQRKAAAQALDGAMSSLLTAAWGSLAR